MNVFFLPFCSNCIHIEMSAHNLALRQTVSGQGFTLFCSPFSFICILTEKVGPQSSLANDGFFLRPQEERKESLRPNSGPKLAYQPFVIFIFAFLPPANEKTQPTHIVLVRFSDCIWFPLRPQKERTELLRVDAGAKLGSGSIVGFLICDLRLGWS